MKTIYITKKINDSDNGSDKIKKKLRKIKDKWYWDPIKLVFAEGIKKINPVVVDNQVLRNFVVEIIYPDSLMELPLVNLKNVRKITISSNLKELCHLGVPFSNINDINLHNNLELIGDETFYDQKCLEIICIYPSVKKIGRASFKHAKIKKFIFLSTNVIIDPSAFEYTFIDKLYCTNKDLLKLLYDAFLKEIDILISLNDPEIINYNLKRLYSPVEELTISHNLILDFVNILTPLKNFFSKQLVKKVIVDCPNDFYYNLLYKEEIEILKEKLCCEIILSHDYVVENFEEAKDVYKEPQIDIYSKEINDKCNQILDSCFDTKLKEKVLNYLIDIVKKHNDTILDEEKHNYNDFNNISLSINNNNYYYGNNTFMDKLDEILNNVNLLNNSILLFLDDIEKLITEINISNTSLNYLDESLYSDIYIF